MVASAQDAASNLMGVYIVMNVNAPHAWTATTYMKIQTAKAGVGPVMNLKVAKRVIAYKTKDVLNVKKGISKMVKHVLPAEKL